MLLSALYRTNQEMRKIMTTTTMPIRLIPVGSEVQVRDGSYGYVSRTVGTPIVLDDGRVVGRYRDIARQWDYVEPETTFEVVSIPAGKRPHKAFNTINAASQS